MTLTQHVANEINKNKVHIPLSGVTAYHLLSGSLTIGNTTITAGMATTLYTGNGTVQSVITGVDMSSQWGNDVSEAFGGLVWVKARGTTSNHALADTLRGATHVLSPNLTDADAINAGTITSFDNDGFSIGASVNTATTWASWVFQTTHKFTGLTNHGKAYTCHYNPFTGFTMTKYEGSGLEDHRVPHHLGRNVRLAHFKRLATVSNWVTSYGDQYGQTLNTTTALAANTLFPSFDENHVVHAAYSGTNNSAEQHIMYGWADSYFDAANNLIGNYEVGTYVGTGAAGNKVTTRGKPAWIMIKRIDTTGSWYILDNVRNAFDNSLIINTTGAEVVSSYLDVASDGFIVQSIAADYNASGGQYLYMVAYDNDTGSGRSKYPLASDTANISLDAVVPFANGIDNSGTKITIVPKNETISGLIFAEGKNYVYALNDGTYEVNTLPPTYGLNNPSLGDFFHIQENQWYDPAGAPLLESRNYLDAIVYADAGGQPTYVEQLPKTEYKDSLNVLGGFDLNEKLYDVTADIISGATYYNTSGRAKFITVVVQSPSGVYGQLHADVDGVIYQNKLALISNTYVYPTLTLKVLNGSSYKFTAISGVLYSVSETY